MENLFTEEEVERRQRVMLTGVTFVGVDPGLDGAVSALLPDGTVQLSDTPSVVVGRGKQEKRDYDLQGMCAILRGYCFGDNQKVHLVIESVHAMKDQGVTSSFNFGKGFGLWLGIAAALRLPYTLVSPQRWKKETMADMPREKDSSRVRALQLFPNTHVDLKLKKHHGRADALLMAHWLKSEREF
jgi:crossover junction endodeoxyribonuclease RuvC